jgi:putative N-acetylmannosamine-6-phosphate epimerase
VILAAVNKGVPVVASQRDRSKSPIKEMIDFSDHMYNLLMANTTDTDEQEDKSKKKSGLSLRLGR